MADTDMRPFGDATVELALPAEPAADTLDESLVAALLAVRDARERLRRVARIVAQLTPTDGVEP